jgi:two-component system, OmpR family, sensor histidine kinase VicK
MSHTYNTEIVYGLDVIIKRTLKRLSNANKKIDASISGVALEGTVKAKPIFDMILLSKKKGVKIRYITEITKQNLPYVRELMKTGEFRHMDEIKGNYSVVDEIDYKATAAVTEGEGPIESVLSTAKAFVDQQ